MKEKSGALNKVNENFVGFGIRNIYLARRKFKGFEVTFSV